MADEVKHGTDWQNDELDAIVEDYFSMLMLDLSGKPYVKAEHNRALMAQIGRTHRSVEFKHQNISAVLEELGMPTIPGYKPKPNYQNAIFDAIDRFLSKHPGIFNWISHPPEKPVIPSEIFVAPPILQPSENRKVPAALQRLVRKFDPIERDRQNRSLGKAGEEYVFHLEQRILIEADRADLARKVRWVAAEDGDGAGYDVLSFDPAGCERLLEVKTTNGSARTPFFLTRNEYETASERPKDWRIYRVHCFAEDPRIFTISPPIESLVYLKAEIWRASF
jgi:hypothetical protein